MRRTVVFTENNKHLSLDSLPSEVQIDSGAFGKNPLANLKICVKILIFTVVVVVLTAAALMTSHQLVIHFTDENQVQQSATSAAHEMKAAFNERIYETAVTQRAVTALPAVRDLVQRAAEGEAISQAEITSLEELLSNIANVAHSDFVTVVDQRGLVVASAFKFHKQAEAYNPHGLTTRVLQSDMSRSPDPLRHSIYTSGEVSGDYLQALSKPLRCEGHFCSSERISSIAFAEQGGIVRYVVTPILQSGTNAVVGAVIAGDVMNARYHAHEAAINSYNGGYAAMYRRDAATGEYHLISSAEKQHSGDSVQYNTKLETNKLLSLADEYSKQRDSNNLVAVGTERSTSGATYQVAVLPLHSFNDEIVGFVVRGIDPSTKTTLVETSLLYEFISIIPALVINIVIALLAARAFTRPLRKLTEAVVGFSNVQNNGDYSMISSVIELPVTSRDEIGVLTHVFNMMSKKIHAMFREFVKDKMRERSVMEAVPDGIVTIRESGEILACNSSFKFMFGLLKMHQSSDIMAPDSARPHYKPADLTHTQSEREINPIGTNILSYIEKSRSKEPNVTTRSKSIYAANNEPESSNAVPSTSVEIVNINNINNAARLINNNATTTVMRMRPNEYVLNEMLQLDNHFALIEATGLMRKADEELMKSPESLLELDHDERSVDQDGEEDIDEVETRFKRFPIVVSHNETWFNDDKAYVLVIRDLRDRKQLEANLREERERAEQLIHRMNAFSKLQSVLKVDKLRAAFKRFCQKLCSDENISYWEEMERFNRYANQMASRDQLSQAWAIYNRFVERGGQHELNISESEAAAVHSALTRIESQLVAFRMPITGKQQQQQQQLSSAQKSSASESETTVSQTNLAEAKSGAEAAEQSTHITEASSLNLIESVDSLSLVGNAAGDTDLGTDTEVGVADEISAIFSSVTKSVQGMIMDSFVQFMKTAEYAQLEKKFVSLFDTTV